MNTVRMPEEDRPVTKGTINGYRSLTISELLSVVINPKAYTANAEAQTIAEKFPAIREIFAQSDEELKRFGFDKVDIARIRACEELGRRFREDEARKLGYRVTSSKDGFSIIEPLMRNLKIEQFLVAYMDSKNRIIQIVTSASGTVDRAFPIVREMILTGLKLGAASMICAHNHPSGDPAPSREDAQFTKEVHEAGKLMQLRMLDHLIIGDNRYYSFADEGEI